MSPCRVILLSLLLTTVFMVQPSEQQMSRKEACGILCGSGSAGGDPDYYDEGAGSSSNYPTFYKPSPRPPFPEEFFVQRCEKLNEKHGGYGGYHKCKAWWDCKHGGRKVGDCGGDWICCKRGG